MQRSSSASMGSTVFSGKMLKDGGFGAKGGGISHPSDEGLSIIMSSPQSLLGTDMSRDSIGIISVGDVPEAPARRWSA